MVFWSVTAVLTATLGLIAIIDMRTLRIPDYLSLPLIGVGILTAWGLPLLPLHHHLVGAVVGYSVFAVIGHWYFSRTGAEGLGLGDAKLFAAAGAWVGWQALPMVLLIATVSGLAFVSFVGRNGRSNAVAFGPWLAVGFWAVWIWQNILTVSW